MSEFKETEGVKFEKRDIMQLVLHNAIRQAKLICAIKQGVNDVKNSQVTYIFDGVLHCTVVPSQKFTQDISEAIYIRPLNMPLVPAYDMLEQLKLDHKNGNKIHLVVSGKEQDRQAETIEFLKTYGVETMITSIIYNTNNVASTLKVINDSHLCYDCNPASASIYAKIGRKFRFVDIMPRLNSLWIY